MAPGGRTRWGGLWAHLRRRGQTDAAAEGRAGLPPRSPLHPTKKPRTDLTPNSSSREYCPPARAPALPTTAGRHGFWPSSGPVELETNWGWGAGPPGRHQGGVCSLVGVRKGSTVGGPVLTLGPSQVSCPGQHLWEGGPCLLFPLEPSYRLMKGRDQRLWKHWFGSRWAPHLSWVPPRVFWRWTGGCTWEGAR